MAIPFQKFIPGFRQFDGTALNNLFTGLMSFTAAIVGGTLDGVTIGGTTPAAGSFTNYSQSAGGTLVRGYTPITAAGATQGNAAALTGAKNIITVSTTASTHGVKLPTASTGLEVEVGNAGTFGVKVYPSTNGKIGAASTNSADATVLAINKVNVYKAVNKTLWIVERGA